MLTLMLLTVALQGSADSTWRDHDRAAREAGTAGNWAAARAHLQRLDTLIGGHPAVVLAIARTTLRLGDTAAAVRDLERVARMGLVVDAADSALRAMIARHPALAGAFAANAAAVGTPRTIATMPLADFVAEGVAYDGTRQRLLVSSIRHGKVIQVSRDGIVSDYVDLARAGWSGLGLAVDSARNRLWVTTMWYPLGLHAAPTDSGRSDVELYDLARGALLRRFELPRGAHEPGDICLAPNGDLYVSDGREGVIRVIRASADSLALFVRNGPFVSPQGCAVDARGDRMFVADYALGLMEVDLATGAVKRVPRPSTVAVNGIDGLTMSGDRLIGVQNGTAPNRVLEIRLSRDHTAIEAVCVIARNAGRIRGATHVAAIGSDIVFVENGGFDDYEPTGLLKAGATPVAPRIGRLSLTRCD